MSVHRSLLSLPVEELDQVVDAVGPRWQQLRNQRLLLTGATGFIGKWLLATFLHANRRLGLAARVVALSRDPASFLSKYPELQGASELTWLNCDVRNLVSNPVDDCGFAIHAATDVVANSNPYYILDTCYVGTRRVLNALSQGRAPRRVLLLSSGAVYGSTPPEMRNIPEDWLGAPDSLTPSSAYGEGKRVSEMLGVIATTTRPGLEVAIARCFAFVGPHLPLDRHFAIGNFIKAAMHSEDICIKGDGTPFRSYLYAGDLAHWLWVMLFDAPSGRAYNVGGDETISIGELAHRVNNLLHGNGTIRISQTPTPGVAPQAYVPAISRIASELGLKPTISLDEAILRTAHWAAQYTGN